MGIVDKNIIVCLACVVAIKKCIPIMTHKVYTFSDSKKLCCLLCVKKVSLRLDLCH